MEDKKNVSKKAVERFKRVPTDYTSGKKCSYGDKQRSCDPGCRFWNSCVKGRSKGR